jgi:hypothetical protein
MLNRGMFASVTDEWETPREFFDALNSVYCFELDVCATRANAKRKRYFTKMVARLCDSSRRRYMSYADARGFRERDPLRSHPRWQCSGIINSKRRRI